MKVIDSAPLRDFPLRSSSYMPRHAAEALCPPPGCAIISITNPDLPPASLRDGWAAVLRISFVDAYDETVPGAFTPEHAQSVKEFVLRNERLPHIVAHCEAGLSRSAAIALALNGLGWALPSRTEAWTANLLVVRRMEEAVGFAIPMPPMRAWLSATVRACR